MRRRAAPAAQVRGDASPPRLLRGERAVRGVRARPPRRGEVSAPALAGTVVRQPRPPRPPLARPLSSGHRGRPRPRRAGRLRGRLPSDRPHLPGARPRPPLRGHGRAQGQRLPDARGRSPSRPPVPSTRAWPASSAARTTRWPAREIGTASPPHAQAGLLARGHVAVPAAHGGRGRARRPRLGAGPPRAGGRRHARHRRRSARRRPRQPAAGRALPGRPDLLADLGGGRRRQLSPILYHAPWYLGARKRMFASCARSSPSTARRRRGKGATPTWWICSSPPAIARDAR